MQIIADACIHRNGCKPWHLFLEAYKHSHAANPLEAARMAFQVYQMSDHATDTVVNYCLDILVPRSRRELQQA